MAGLWERIKPDAVDRLPSHALHACIVAYIEGDATAQQLLAFANGQLASELDGDELTDLTAIRAAIDSLGTIGQKYQYAARLHAYCLMAEVDQSGTITEAKWRNKLGL